MNPTDPAFPVPVVNAPDLSQEAMRQFAFAPTGMDLRTYIATAVLQGIMANEGPDSLHKFSDLVSDAVRLADALIEQLNAK